MARRIYIKGVPRKELDIDLYVHTLITLARELDEQERQRAADVPRGKSHRPKREAPRD
jgi:hypothetical protein